MAKPSELAERLMLLIQYLDDKHSATAEDMCNKLKPVCIGNWTCEDCPLGDKTKQILAPLINRLKVVELLED